mgnify:FL=1
MVYYLTVQNYEDFEALIKSKNLKISKAVVENILDNLNTKKRFIYALEITIEDDNKIVSLTIDRKDFIVTLEKNLEIFVYHEAYEECTKIQEAINKLKAKHKPKPKPTI